MKKSFVLGILGLTTAAVTSYGQGYIQLDNYIGGGSLIVYGIGMPANGVSGALGTPGAPIYTPGWTVGFYWLPGSQSIFDPPGTGMPSGASWIPATGAGSTAQVAGWEVFGQAGYYSSVAAFNSGSTLNTTLTLEVVIYDSYGGSYAGANYRMHSAPFTMPTAAATATSFPSTGTFMPGRLFDWIPEPSALTLAGLGGLALWFLRRKKP